MRRRLHPFVWTLIGFALMLGIALWRADSTHLAVRGLTKEEVSAMIDQRRTFCLQVSKKGCMYCETLRELEGRSNRLDGMVVYELEFPENPSEEDRQWLEDALPHFDYYPALFIVRADEIVCVEVNDLSEFDEEIVPQIIEANGGNHEGQ